MNAECGWGTSSKNPFDEDSNNEIVGYVAKVRLRNTEKVFKFVELLVRYDFRPGRAHWPRLSSQTEIGWILMSLEPLSEGEGETVFLYPVRGPTGDRLACTVTVEVSRQKRLRQRPTADEIRQIKRKEFPRWEGIHGSGLKVR